MDDKRKIIIIVVIVVALVILISLLTIKLIKIEKNKGKEVFNSNENAIKSNIIENDIENDIENEIIENAVVDTEKEENNKNNSQNTSPSIGEEEVTKTEIEKEETNKEKAMNIVKKDWGEDDNVYFTFESIDSRGNYIVYVREGETTRAISSYTINLETGTFTKE